MTKKISRLRKVVADGYGYGFSAGEVPILVGNPMELVDNKDELADRTYGPSISREWEFEKPRDNMEWHLQSNN